MVRSPSDATRFTATGPYASSSQTNSPASPSSSVPPTSSPSGSQLPLGSPIPKGETAQQKIARLRAAAALAKRGDESAFDRVVRVGRVWADRAHRFTALGLIGFSVVSGVVAVAGVTDMLLHNRKRRNEWFAEQRAKSARELAEAMRAMDEGRETEEQRLVLNRARAAMEAEDAKRNRPGVFKRTTDWLFSDLSSEDQKGGRLGARRGSAEKRMPELEAESLGSTEDRGVLHVTGDGIESLHRSGEKADDVYRPLGGPLDREARNLINSASQTGRSWTAWITGR